MSLVPMCNMAANAITDITAGSSNYLIASAPAAKRNMPKTTLSLCHWSSLSQNARMWKRNVGTKGPQKRMVARQVVWHAMQAKALATAEDGLLSLDSAPDNPSPEVWPPPPLPVQSLPVLQRLLVTLVLCSSIPINAVEFFLRNRERRGLPRILRREG